MNEHFEHMAFWIRSRFVACHLDIHEIRWQTKFGLRRKLSLVHAPRSLSLSFSGWPPEPSSISSTAGYLMYPRPDNEWADTVIKTTDTQWIEFWKICDDVGLWDWPTQIGDMMDIDGLMFSLSIERPGVQFRRSGQLSSCPKELRNGLERVYRHLVSMTEYGVPKGFGAPRSNDERRPDMA